MLFGNKQKFGIEVNSHESINEHFFGQITLWVGGDQIGDKDIKVMLSIPACEYHATKNKDRNNQLTEKMDALTAWKYLDFHSFGQGNGSTEKYNICINYSESFDGESLFLVTYHRTERYLWKKFRSETVKELKLPLGEYQKVVEKFTGWFNSLNQ